MPYIQKELRVNIDESLNKLIHDLATEFDANCKPTPSYIRITPKSLAKEITYSFFKILKTYYADKDWYGQGDVDKILESVKDEFHERFIRPYEKKAREKNGDVE